MTRRISPLMPREPGGPVEPSLAGSSAQPARLCLQCQGWLVRRPIEDDWAWNKRRFCSRKCSSSYSVRQKWSARRTGSAVSIAPKGPKTEDPSVWLQHNQVTLCPPGYALGTQTFNAYYSKTTQRIMGRT